MSLSSGNAWDDICRQKNSIHLQKDSKWFGDSNQSTNILNCNDHDHTHIRKVVAQGFSASGLKQQESLLSNFLSQLRKHYNTGEEIVHWYNLLTFDVIGDLSLGEPFHALKTCQVHPWINSAFDAVKSSRTRRTAAFLTHILEYNALENHMTHKNVIKHTYILIITRSKKIATHLSGLTFFLLRNPETLLNAQQEVRHSYESEEQITLLSMSRLEYLQACINEALRLYPPVTLSIPRITSPHGNVTRVEHLSARINMPSTATQTTSVIRIPTCRNAGLRIAPRGVKIIGGRPFSRFI